MILKYWQLFFKWYHQRYYSKFGNKKPPYFRRLLSFFGGGCGDLAQNSLHPQLAP